MFMFLPSLGGLILSSLGQELFESQAQISKHGSRQVSHFIICRPLWDSCRNMLWPCVDNWQRDAKLMSWLIISARVPVQRYWMSMHFLCRCESYWKKNPLSLLHDIVAVWLFSPYLLWIFGSSRLDLLVDDFRGKTLGVEVVFKLNSESLLS